ncbi:hypothetical protein OS493_013025 [Desmophyllum pertusum]|uniref:Uncharacterized protein n=1 Tax=Desmophyllum pertusum TaxID=174260 RepID=A0A9W9Z1V3_9CNID|nr:hypothetical protein OS493_013025 [Desmophyllum pertusum]
MSCSCRQLSLQPTQQQNKGYQGQYVFGRGSSKAFQRNFPKNSKKKAKNKRDNEKQHTSQEVTMSEAS